MPRNPPPLTSFGPELMATLRKAGTEVVEIEFPTYKLACRFQQRIYQLRTSMRFHSHPDYAIATRVGSKLVWGSKAGYHKEPDVRYNAKNVPIPVGDPPAKLIFYPRDSEFAAILSKAKIDVPSVDQTPVTAPSVDGVKDMSFLDDFITENSSDVEK